MWANYYNAYTCLYGISGKFPHFSPPFDLGWVAICTYPGSPSRPTFASLVAGNPLHER